MHPPGTLSPRAKILLWVLMLTLAVVSVHRLVCAAPRRAVEVFEGPTMGTTWSVKIVAGGFDAEERARIRGAIDAELDRVVRLMSTWETDSELSRFNRHRASTPFTASAETLEVLRVAREVSEASGGAFDVTVGPLVEAWGFGPMERPPRPPSEAEVARLRERVGHHLVEIDETSGTLTKRHPDTVCDLSAIAKGHAVDRVAEALAALGHTDFLVEIGGEVRARGARPDDRPWRVAIETPDPEARILHRVVELRDRAMATSGDYRNFYESEGVWISHLIDPRSARPIDHGLASVSVIHPQAIWADAWATALIVLGPEEGFELARREELAAYFMIRKGEGGLATRATPAFEALFGDGEDGG